MKYVIVRQFYERFSTAIPANPKSRLAEVVVAEGDDAEELSRLALSVPGYYVRKAKDG